MPLRGWVRREELKKTTDTDFHIPDLKYIEDRSKQKWDRQEAHTLIDEYARITWGRKSEYRSAMGKLVGHFLQLWDKQEGLCAITKIPLLGGPGMNGYGVGIDLLRKKQGPRKGNIRLVSCPLAVHRYRYPTLGTQRIELPIKKDFGNFDISYSIAHHLYWHFDKYTPFKFLPVWIDFPFGKPDTYFPRWSQSKSAILVRFRWTIGIPPDTTWGKFIESQEIFFRASICDDVILTAGINEDSFEDHYWSMFDPTRVRVGQTIPLSDPTVNLEKEITERAKHSLLRGLHVKLRRAN
jgi:hypothetical protein